MKLGRTRAELEDLYLQRQAKSLNLKMSADPIGRNRPTSRSELKLTAAQWKNLLDNRDQPEEGAILRFAASQAGLIPSEKLSQGAASTPAGSRPDVKKQIALLEGRLLGKRRFCGGSGEEIQALADEISSLKAQVE